MRASPYSGVELASTVVKGIWDLGRGKEKEKASALAAVTRFHLHDVHSDSLKPVSGNPVRADHLMRKNWKQRNVQKNVNGDAKDHDQRTSVVKKK